MGRSANVTFVISSLCMAATASAQVEDKKFLEEQRRQELEEQERKKILEEEYKQDFIFDYGAWFRSEFIRFDDKPFRDTRTIRFYDLRVWASAIAWQHYHLYARMLNQYIDFNSGDQFKGDTDDRFRFRLDEAYVEADWSNVMSGPYDSLKVKAGRQYFRLGRGLVYSNVADGLQANLTRGPWSFMVFGANTIISDDDIDRSIPDPGHSYRFFVGGQASWRAVGAHTFYALGLLQHDYNDNDPSTPSQKWDYNSNYVGLGAQGPIIQGLSYQAEIDYEFGTSTDAGAASTDRISAWAFLARLEYFPGWPTSPVFDAEYIFGSGDADRGSPTDTVAGNTAGTQDNGFLAFGYMQTGFALFPRVSNIHIFRIGAAFKPLENVEFLKTLELGTALYFYRKDKAAETISDPRSFLNSNDVGKEWDVYLRWRIFSDLGISINYGLFLPGKAYDDTGNSNRNFLSLGVTYTF